MYSSFEIGNIKVGIGEEPLVIPEMGINHEGSLKVAKLIVDAASRAGAKIIKHQTHIIEDEMSHAAKDGRASRAEKRVAVMAPSSHSIRPIGSPITVKQPPQLAASTMEAPTSMRWARLRTI